MEGLTRIEGIEEQKGILLKTLKDAAALNGNDKLYYPGQDKPMSYHLVLLIQAVEANDKAIMADYRKGEGNWFPYAGSVEKYLEFMELLGE